MTLRRLLTAFLFFTLPLLSTPGAFGAIAMPSHVKASLVAADASVQPGKAITVALRLVHEPKWHTYWSNPGTGLATAIEWKLPPGWKAGDKTSWEQHLKTRAQQGQNEYTKVN